MSSVFFSYWDMAYDVDVMENRVGLNLLYTQVRSVSEDKPTLGLISAALTAKILCSPFCTTAPYWITGMEQEGQAIY